MENPVMNHCNKRLSADGKLTVHEIDDRAQVGPENHTKIIDPVNNTGVGHRSHNNDHHNCDTGDSQLIEPFFPYHPDIIPHNTLQNQHAEDHKQPQPDQTGCSRNLEKEVVQAADTPGR